MPQKTKREKLLAEQRRKHEMLHSQTIKYSLDLGNNAQKVASSKTDHGLQTEIGHIKKDLLKITVFTVLAILFQLSLHFFVIK
jgi:hypothetical protein